MSPTPDSPARAALLGKARELLEERGRLSDLTLRQFATRLGTSHRMLIYHFGSRDGLLAALLSELRREEQHAVLDRAGTLSRREAVELLESRYLAGDPVPRLRAFYYVLGLAAQDPDGYAEFLDSLQDWVRLFTELGVREGLAEDGARRDAQVLVWTARGLLFEAATSADGTRAVEDFHAIVRRLGI